MTGLGVVLTAASAADRSGTDFYPTPPEATAALLTFLDLPFRTRIWEPACGEGHISRVLLDARHQVYSSDLHDRGYGEPLRNFLSSPVLPMPEGLGGRPDWIITNPPFSQAEAFIRHALMLGRPFAFLLKGQYWHAAGRRALFEMHRPEAVLPLTWRPDFLMGKKGGSPTMEAAWTVWGAAPATHTVYAPLPRPEVQP